MASAPDQVGAKATPITGPQYVSLRLPDPSKPETLRPFLVTPKQAAYMLIITRGGPTLISSLKPMDGEIITKWRTQRNSGQSSIVSRRRASRHCSVLDVGNMPSRRSAIRKCPAYLDHCRRTISYQDEVRARDLYWKVTLDETKLTDSEKDSFLLEAVQYNPFVAEPHVLLAQTSFGNQRFREASHHANGIKQVSRTRHGVDKRLEYGSMGRFHAYSAVPIRSQVQRRTWSGIESRG